MIKDDAKMNELLDNLDLLYMQASDTEDPTTMIKAFNALVTAYERVIIIACDGTEQLTDEQRSNMIYNTFKSLRVIMDEIVPPQHADLPDNVIQFNDKRAKKDEKIH